MYVYTDSRLVATILDSRTRMMKKKDKNKETKRDCIGIFEFFW